MIYTRVYKDDTTGEIIHVACQSEPFTFDPVTADPRNNALVKSDHEIELPEEASITAREVLDNFELNGAGQLAVKAAAPPGVKNKVLAVLPHVPA